MWWRQRSPAGSSAAKDKDTRTEVRHGLPKHRDDIDSEGQHEKRPGPAIGAPRCAGCENASASTPDESRGSRIAATPDNEGTASNGTEKGARPRGKVWRLAHCGVRWAHPAAVPE